MRCGIPEGVVCDLDLVTWRRRLEELIRGGDNFNTSMYLEPVQRFENTVRIGGPGSCNSSTSKCILDMLKAI